MRYFIYIDVYYKADGNHTYWYDQIVQRWRKVNVRYTIKDVVEDSSKGCCKEISKEEMALININL